jgi:hypothetical protein
MNLRESTSTLLIERAVRSRGRARIRVLGTSMAPSVLPGDWVDVQRAELRAISPGEIILFSRDERLFVHRAVSCVQNPETPILITRGDRLDHDDPPVTSAELLGRVISIQRGRRTFRPDVSSSQRNGLLSRVLRASDFFTRTYLYFLRRRREMFAVRTEWL